ncbi:MAG: SDR family oxidoreductase [Chloroflexi bacterium]|nr:SDR family oxidoreductase [Chloroflexota bacterium]
MSLTFSLADKVAIVTGAGRGIGRGIALGLARAGANVVVAELQPAEAEKTAAEIRALGRKSLGVATDVRSNDQVAAMVKKTLDEFKTIDILVNNVGVFGRETPSLKVTGEGWDSLLQANLKGAFLCARAVAEVMVGQGKGGSIISISSLGGLVPPLGFTAYNAAKAGVINMTQSLAVEWGPQHIRVNCVAPGWIETEYNSRGFQTDPSIRSRLKWVPLQRAGKPEDIAGAVVYLASDAADFVTGVTILVDGGLHSVQPY